MQWIYRANRVVVTAGLAVASIWGATSCGISSAMSTDSANEYCAIMSDSVGLYVGNHVTQMGYPIGEVRRIEPRASDVKVVFSLDTGRPIPEEVRAVTRSPSILADRALELVGNYTDGPKLRPAECIPMNRTSTPLSIAEIIGSATDFVNAVNPEGSTNIADSLKGIDQAMSGQGDRLNQLMSRSSQLLDSPDRAISQLGQITRNVAELTSMVRDNRADIKTIVTDLPSAVPNALSSLEGAYEFDAPFVDLITIVNDIEIELGPEFQTALDATGELMRIASPHYKGIANMLNPLPRWISGVNGEPPGATEGGFAKRANNHPFIVLPYRPPLFRIPTANGLLACGAMNASAPGSCADVAGRPYAVDVALLQYVLTEAQRR
ncbi:MULTISPECIES: MlaD family protein [Mycolicibacterium]|uniref:Mammalian cell entry protein n=1 Tax=Mycolicibacterium fortuitum TaxID=1766 RepID=A0ABD6QJV8_MYCFO|nr:MULTISPECIES: MlaD family protein [Mycolicibacterium]OMB87185.1 mammalian cell entry protein [Mycolicibacterium conceptionense]OMC42633.1 mammalian cell entry protein [Mycolicibacterium fortuitum]